MLCFIVVSSFCSNNNIRFTVKIGGIISFVIAMVPLGCELQMSSGVC